MRNSFCRVILKELLRRKIFLKILCNLSTLPQNPEDCMQAKHHLCGFSVRRAGHGFPTGQPGYAMGPLGARVLASPVRWSGGTSVPIYTT